MNKNIKILLITTLIFSSILLISPLNEIKAYSATRNEWKYDVYFAPHVGANIETWNYYGADGKPKVGWFCVDGKWYYGDEEHFDGYYGIYIDKWAPTYYKEYVDSSNVWHVDFGGFNYYCGSDGAMKTGWFQAYSQNDGYYKKDGLHWYYAGPSGKIFKNMYTPDGYWVNSEGIWK